MAITNVIHSNNLITSYSKISNLITCPLMVLQNLCYVAADYNELQKDTQASCEVSDEGIFISSKEHFQAAEIFSSCKLEGCKLLSYMYFTRDLSIFILTNKKL